MTSNIRSSRQTSIKSKRYLKATLTEKILNGESGKMSKNFLGFYYCLYDNVILVQKN